VYRVLLVISFLAICLQTYAGVTHTDIEVNADRVVGKLQPLWRDFAEGSESVDPEYLAGTVVWMKPLSPRLVRTDTVMNGFLEVKFDDKGMLSVDFTRLDKWLDVLSKTGAKPLICIAYTPQVLRSGEREISPPKDLKLWEELVYRLVKHVNVDRKLSVKYWEVWNEPNLDIFWTGSKEQYLELYRATVRGVLRADPTVKVGGPGVAGSDGSWIVLLLDYVKANKLRLDFVSWHDYRVPPEYHKQMARRVKGWLYDRGMDAELLITEWNYDAGLHPGNDDERGAAYVARCLHNMVDSPLNYAQFFEIKDGWNADSEYWGRWGMITFNNHPKAVYYAYRMFAMLGTERVRVIGGTASVNGLASRNGDELCILLYSTSKTENWSGLDDQVSVNLRITGLPTGRLRWERFLMDLEHSNPVKQGNDSTLERVAEAITSAKQGIIETRVLLQSDAVTLIRITPSASRNAKDLPPPQPVTVTYPMSSARAIYRQREPIIDGSLSDWSSPTLEFGPDGRARARFEWDEKALYIGVEVADSQHVQTRPESEIYAEDSMQIGFDALANALPGEPYGPDDYEYGFALTKNGQIAWRYECPGWKQSGRVDNANVAIRRDDSVGVTVYEVAIPWAELDPAEPAAGKIFRVSLLVNDVGPGTERTILEWGGGIAGKKQPELFRAIMLMR